jgi:hypothetical protein
MQGNGVLALPHPTILLRKPPLRRVVIPSPQVVLVQGGVILLPRIPVRVLGGARLRLQLPERAIRVGITDLPTLVGQRPCGAQSVVLVVVGRSVPGLAQQVVAMGVPGGLGAVLAFGDDLGVVSVGMSDGCPIFVSGTVNFG